MAQLCQVSDGYTCYHVCLCQLRFEEGDWACRTKEPGRNMLHELASAIPILHELLQKGMPSPQLR